MQSYDTIIYYTTILFIAYLTFFIILIINIIQENFIETTYYHI
jgi:hypothetical protein